MAKIELELIPLTVPTSVQIQMPPAPRQDGFQEATKIPLGDLSPKVLDQLLADFCTRTKAEAKKQRMAKTSAHTGNGSTPEP
jgi:hypothetical protein